MGKPVVRNAPNELDKLIANRLSAINGNMNFAGFAKRFVNNIEGEADKGLTDKQQRMAVLILCKFRRQINGFQTIVNQLPIELKTLAAEYLKGKK